MYVYAQDPSSRDMVGILSTAQPYTEDINNGEMVESIMLQQSVANSSARGIFILILDQQYPNPNAAWRKRYGDLRGQVRFKDFRFAIVTPSKLMRGALTAINWVTPNTARFQADAFQTFEEATRWVAAGHESRIPPLGRLQTEAQNALRRKAELAASSAR